MKVLPNLAPRNNRKTNIFQNYLVQYIDLDILDMTVVVGGI